MVFSAFDIITGNVLEYKSLFVFQVKVFGIIIPFSTYL
jgi:hypothetical protein